MNELQVFSELHKFLNGLGQMEELFSQADKNMHIEKVHRKKMAVRSL